MSEVNDYFSITTVINAIFGVLYQLIILIVSAYYIYRKQSIDGYLMSAGAFIHLFTSLFYSLGLPFLTRNHSVSGISVYMGIASLVSLVASVLFIVGFIMLVFKYIGTFKSETSHLA